MIYLQRQLDFIIMVMSISKLNNCPLLFIIKEKKIVTLPQHHFKRVRIVCLYF